jgi:L-lactate dehydrogenase complex protein LldF
MKPTSHAFKETATRALADEQLQQALSNVRRGFVAKRAKARAGLPEFDSLRDQARDIKDHTLGLLDLYLEEFERKVEGSGGQVHWALTAGEACETVLDICRRRNAKTVTKGKSMIGEEIAINEHLEAAGLKVVETDLGEYLIQLRGEAPSHIIGPAIHLTRGQIADDFRRIHTQFPSDRPLDDASHLVAEAREILREQFLAADVGITGANLLIAETGTSVIVTNEGNGDLTQTLPKTHIVIASIEKIVPTLEDANTILRVLARSATGQEMSAYTTYSTGPRRDGDPDGPEEFHVVLIDNGRTEMLGSEFKDMLRCIRCGACLNHCPVYNVVGGHAYGWVYSGPMGAVLTPSLIGVGGAGHLPNASSFCGRCEEVCPMRIPLPGMMRSWREREVARGQISLGQRLAIKVWAYLAKRPALYRAATGATIGILGALGAKRGRFRWLPLAGAWTGHRDLPAPQGRTFIALWRGRQQQR